jgi:hypothetical protein
VVAERPGQSRSLLVKWEGLPYCEATWEGRPFAGPGQASVVNADLSGVSCIHMRVLNFPV